MQMNEQALDERFTTVDEAKSLSAKRSFLWSLFIFLVGLAIGGLPLFYKSNFAGLLQLAGFLLLGFFYAVAQQKNTLAIGGSSFWSTVAFCVVLILLTGILWYFAHALEPLRLVALACAFLLPNVVTAAWWAFCTANVAPKPLWFYTMEIPEEAPFVYLEKKSLRLRVYNGNKTAEEYTAVVPATSTLGHAFFYAVKSGRSREQWQPYFLDEHGSPYGWAFYPAKLGLWKNYLQPEETLFENNIDSNSIIIAKRLTDGEETVAES